ncbi:hypothetical protein LguiA_031471 [Lonicera macranthoides]
MRFIAMVYGDGGEVEEINREEERCTSVRTVEKKRGVRVSAVFSPVCCHFLPVSMAFLFRHSYFTTTARANNYQIRALSNSRPTFPRFTVSSSSIRPRSRPLYIPHRIPDRHYVRIFDTTLRDGEQSPGATMTAKEKLEIAKQLAKLGVDAIEAGFPASSAADLEAVKMIAREVGNAGDQEGSHVPVICGLARCSVNDIEAAWEGVKMAKKGRIHTFIATSEIHMKYKLRKTKEEVVEIAGVWWLIHGVWVVMISDREFLYKILGEVIKAGATTLNILDTVGYTMPNDYGQLIADIKANTTGIEMMNVISPRSFWQCVEMMNVIISTHCQNDLGLSTANTLAGACAGARQVEVTINGIGERAGNASLEEVVMALKCRGEQVLGGLYIRIKTRHIVLVSKMVEEYSGLHVQPHKAIVGANAFAHESRIHQVGHGWVLITIANQSTVQPKSGRHALTAKLQELGYDINGMELDDIFRRFKAVAEKKKCNMVLWARATWTQCVMPPQHTYEAFSIFEGLPLDS